MSSADLYGQAVKLVKNIGAYAAMPGTGPAGKKCKDCKHFIRRSLAKTYFKCGMGKVTGGKATDIKATAPSCKLFEGASNE